MLGLDSPLREPPAMLPEEIAGRDMTLRELTDEYILRVLDRVDHNYAAASRILGVDRTTIRRRAERLGI